MANTDNSYLKTILSKVKGETVSGVKTNNKLLKEISENIGTGGSADLGTVAMTITYTDQTSETINLAVWESEE